jgi:outer membrane protein TolC
MIKDWILFLTALFTLPVFSQQSITLEACYELVTTNYPLVQQNKLLEQQSNLDKEGVSTAILPQLQFEAQATYQSDVIEIPLQNVNIEPLNNDQYRATLSVNQLIYNAGATTASLQVKTAQLKTKLKQIEVSLYQLKQQINQVYFSILLAQETVSLLNAKRTQLEAKQVEVRSGIKNGVLLQASDKVLQAELLKLGQTLTEVQSNRTTLLLTLSSLINQQIPTSTILKTPILEMQVNGQLNRPELDLFQLKKEEIGFNESLLAKKNAPRVMGFVTGGYGNPGLNMLDNSFQAYYIAGLKLSWNVFDWNYNKKQVQSLSINKDLIDTDKDVFTLNTSIELDQQQQEINKIEILILSDVEIINLRKEVLQSADSRLKNGVITSSAYITELTHLYEDENTLLRHQTQLQLAKANYNVIKGY